MRSLNMWLYVVVFGLCLAQCSSSRNGTNFSVASNRAEIERSFYLSELFKNYGNKSKIITRVELMRLTTNIGLKFTKDMAHKKETSPEMDKHCHEPDANCKLSEGGHKARKRSYNNHHNHQKCLHINELLSVYHISGGVNQDTFMNLCPSLIVLLDKSECTNAKRLHSSSHDHEDHSSEPRHSEYSLSKIPVTVWGYSCLSILVISLVGLLGVAVIPIMQKVFYNHLLQFLVALAVGALSGDAMLHLIPHSLAGGMEHLHNEHDENVDELSNEQQNVFKGLVALVGIYMFFFIERMMTIITDIKRRRKEELHFEHQLELAAKIGDSEIEHVKQCHESSQQARTEHDCESLNLGIHPGKKALEYYAEEANKEKREDETMLKKVREKKEAKNSKRKLSHSHSHSHGDGEIPSDIASVAWMVILGDGVHNFCDGLAIGSAFAATITGGISTSIAVFCHELPHEIGDFAVLLKAGMKPKQALVYNIVSSVLAFCGMIVGVILGNIESASLWIFTIVGGMFLYIALVDMLPEMMALDTRPEENPFCHLVIQICGMMLGIGIMLLIALYEEKMINMFES